MQRDHFPPAKNTTPDSARRLPIVFVLDTTVSMLNVDGNDTLTRLDRLNATIKQVLKDAATSTETAAHVEVAFVAFTEDVVMVTDFEAPGNITPAFFTNAAYYPCCGATQQVSTEPAPYIIAGHSKSLTVPVFHHFPVCTDTRIATGVMRAIDMIEKRKLELERTRTSYFVPILITVTDGNPRDNSTKTGVPAGEADAQYAVYQHCFSKGNARNLIIPLFIGIGENANVTELQKYSRGYRNGMRIVHPSNDTVSYREMAFLIRKSITKSISLNNWKELTSRGPKPRETFDATRWETEGEQSTIEQALNND